ncbi:MULTISPECIES: hypothetical protein [Bacillus]|nr:MULTISPECIES: hypothetical protein [unclassified Bacillus (in: firmicutes)]
MFLMYYGVWYFTGYIGSLLFKNYPIRTAQQIRGTEGKATESAA